MTAGIIREELTNRQVVQRRTLLVVGNLTLRYIKATQTYIEDEERTVSMKKKNIRNQGVKKINDVNNG